jgi:hypothetical protein
MICSAVDVREETTIDASFPAGVQTRCGDVYRAGSEVTASDLSERTLPPRLPPIFESWGYKQGSHRHIAVPALLCVLPWSRPPRRSRHSLRSGFAIPLCLRDAQEARCVGVRTPRLLHPPGRFYAVCPTIGINVPTGRGFLRVVFNPRDPITKAYRRTYSEDARNISGDRIICD